MIRNPKKFSFDGFIYTVDEKFFTTLKQMLIPYEDGKVVEKPTIVTKEETPPVVTKKETSKKKKK